MLKLRLILLLISIFSITNAQKVDTIINSGIYKSYFCKQLKEPLYVSYVLYKAGGDCDRSKFHFKNDVKGLSTATQTDYNGCGYDEGHLANAADFSKNCIEDEKTFRFYNCLPQTPNLNRGIWKHWETDLRKLSQTDSLFIICGGTFTDKSKTIGPDKAFVPDYCWKVVVSLKDNKILHTLLFTNDNNAVVKEVTLSDLEKLTKFNIPTKK